MPNSVHVTDHALQKMKHGEGRTHLWYGEVKFICTNKLYVNLGRCNNTEFRLVWDPYLEKAVVFLVKKKSDQEVVISIWETWFIGLPAEVTEAQKETARGKMFKP